MVTSNKLSDKKVVKMSDHSSGAVVPQRTLISEVNEYITCPLCRGYYIDATTIVECLHSFCRSCIIKHLQVKSYCPVCEMMINSAKPNIKLDKALQDIVYKLVPGLFQKEMERRQQFYASRPGPAASATPEQRGEDTERIIFSPEDVISFSLEYADATDTDSISSKSSDSNDPQPAPVSTRRFLQCPAVVNISHLKKFLSVKFDIDSTHCAIGILYKRVPLPDYYTLMDIAYIYNWKRNEPMRFFYQIIDYVAIRNRLFDINRKSSNLKESKPSPASTEDTNVSSPAPNLNDHGSETSSGADSPMPDENSIKQTNDTLNKKDMGVTPTNQQNSDNSEDVSSKNTDEDVEKSQFLNSFELTAKNNHVPVKSSPNKNSVPSEKIPSTEETIPKIQTPPKVDIKDKSSDNLKRKNVTSPSTPELKKLKIELEKAKISDFINNSQNATASTSNQNNNSISLGNVKETEGSPKSPQSVMLANSAISNLVNKECKQPETTNVNKQLVLSNLNLKRNVTTPQLNNTPKRKSPNTPLLSVQLPAVGPKTIPPLKLPMPKFEPQTPFSTSKLVDSQKQPAKKIPDLKPSIPISQSSQSKIPPVTKVRMDLLANNSDPTIDRSKILSQVNSSLSAQSSGSNTGDPLKSLFDSCKINIPSSLSITLTDQKLERNPTDSGNVDPKKGIINKNLVGANNMSTHKVPSPPVHNYIEILKLPDTESKKQNKNEGTSEVKVNPPTKTDAASTSQLKSINKSSESTAKGPIPNLKPIADTKLGKQSGNFTAPITFQQTFEQQLQSLQCDKKAKLPKTKTQVPKLVPATPKSLSAAGKLSNPVNKMTLPVQSAISGENKTGTALDLSTPHNNPSQLGSQQTYDKTLETMQSIANLAKKQNLHSKSLPMSMSHSNVFPCMASRPLTTGVSPLRIPSTSNINQIRNEKNSPIGTQNINIRVETPNKPNQIKPTNSVSPTVSSPNYIQIASHSSPGPSQPSPRSQTRSPSSSPKLVIAEEKQVNNLTIDNNLNQSNQVTSTQVSNVNPPKSESPKASPGPSKPGPKVIKPLASNKGSAIWQPLPSTIRSIPPTMNAPSDVISQQLARQLEMNAWIKAQKQYDFMKNMTNIVHQTQNDFNNKDKI